MPYYSLNGQCMDSALILGAFREQYPMLDQAGNYVSHVSSSITGTNLAYSLEQRNISTNNVYSRSGTLRLTSCDPNAIYQQQGIDAAAIGEAFGWGFGAVILFWSLGYAVGVATGTIKRA